MPATCRHEPDRVPPEPKAQRPAVQPGSAGGPASFDMLYRQHYRRVLGLCRHLLRNDQAEDATQEVFIRAYRAFAQYDPAQPFGAWVLKIASNYCIDVVRRHCRERAVFGDEELERLEIEADDGAAIDHLIAAENAVRVRAAIARLPDKHRIPLVLAYFNESSYDEIATTLGVTRNHVGVLILRGKQAVRRQLAAGTPATATPPNTANAADPRGEER